MIKIGSLFSGIGGFELGLERAIPNSETIWQVEQNTYCQGILKKHWPQAKIFDDVRNISKDNVEPVNILCGGFPCQDISVAGKMGGLTGERSGLWWEMWRIIGELRPRIIVLENVANIIRLGGREVLGSLAQIGYDAEWCIVSAKSQGAPHKRDRWFCVSYPKAKRFKKQFFTKSDEEMLKFVQINIQNDATNPHSESKPNSPNNETSLEGDSSNEHNEGRSYWERYAPESPLCSVDDGIPQRVARLKALGNAIVPQCSEWVGKQIWNSGLLEDLA